jgi:glycogen operon protein
MIAFRKSHPTIARSRFYRDDIHWYGAEGSVDTSPESHHFAYYLDGRSQSDVDLYVMINAGVDDRSFQILEPGDRPWRRVIDTSRPAPQDILDPGQEQELSADRYRVNSRSVVVLLRP